jgi:AcrR family transcriptional regulator
VSASEARDRILSATAARLLAVGAAKVNMQDVADEAGVSKGLIHYHFDSKDTLLARTVEWLSAQIERRERAALDGATAQAAIEMLWRWLLMELNVGHVRILADLAHYPSAEVEGAFRASATRRREATAGTITTLFNSLQLTPRVPAALLADVVMAFNAGLAMNWSFSSDAERRVAFDVFWLAILSLAE